MIKTIQKIIFIGSILLPHSGMSMDTESAAISSPNTSSGSKTKSYSYETNMPPFSTSESPSHQGGIDTDSTSDSSYESSSSSVYVPTPQKGRIKDLTKEIIGIPINDPVLRNFEPLMGEAVCGLKKLHFFGRLHEEGLWKIIWSHLDDHSKLKIALLTRGSYKIIGQNMLLYFGELKINAELGCNNPVIDFDHFFQASQYLESLRQENPSKDNPFNIDFQEIKKTETKSSQDNLFAGCYLPELKDRASSILKTNELEAGRYLKSIPLIIQNNQATKTEYHKLGEIYHYSTKDSLKVSGSANHDSDKLCNCSWDCSRCCNKACTSHNIEKGCCIILCCPVIVACSPCILAYVYNLLHTGF